MLSLENLDVEVEGNKILEGINLQIEEGETLVLFGPNGAGKTSLLFAIMGFPAYKVTKGKITFKGKVINGLTIDERANLGIGLSFQRPPVVRGVKTREMVNIISKSKANPEKLAKELNLEDFLDRDINLGFSGGEIKRSELLHLLAQSPSLSLIDEPESGVDLENILLIGKAINKLLQKDSAEKKKRSGVIITHTGYILDYVEADRGCVLAGKRIRGFGKPKEILKYIQENGYDKCVVCQKFQK